MTKNKFIDAPTMLGVAPSAAPLDPDAPPCTPPAEDLTRPQAVAALMRLQKRIAFEGRAVEVEALTMAIHNICRRHRHDVRHTARRYPKETL